MHRTTVLALLAALLATASAPVPEVAARDRCRVPADAEEVRRSAEVIAFRADLNDLGGGFWACRRDERRRRLIEFDDPLSRSVDAFRVAGPYLGYVVSSPPGCKADCPPEYEAPVEVVVEEVGTGSGRSLDEERDVRDLALSRDGVLVWTGTDRFGRGVVRRLSRGFTRRTLDAGAVDPRSLRVRGRTATWTTGGVARRATLPTR